VLRLLGDLIISAFPQTWFPDQDSPLATIKARQLTRSWPKSIQLPSSQPISVRVIIIIIILHLLFHLTSSHLLKCVPYQIYYIIVISPTFSYQFNGVSHSYFIATLISHLNSLRRYSKSGIEIQCAISFHFIALHCIKYSFCSLKVALI
jgi:hypothetical protein